jgi:hypothetical protein
MTSRYRIFRATAATTLVLVGTLATAVQAGAYVPEFHPYESYGIGSSPQSVAIADVDADGRNELLATTNYLADPDHDNKLWIYRRMRDGSLVPTKYDTHASIGSSMGMAVSDVNDDGLNDVAVASGTAGLEGFFQAGDGTLSAAQRIVPAYGADHLTVADMDRDGRSDIVLNRWIGVDVLFRRAGGYETVSLPSSHSLESEVGDVNGDGLLDVVALGLFSSGVGVYTQQPTGGFTLNTIPIPQPNNRSEGLAVGDVTGDGADDIVITRAPYTTPATIDVFPQVPGQGVAAAPVSYPVSAYPGAVDIADVNRDGLKDVVVAHEYSVGVVPQTAVGSLGGEVTAKVPPQLNPPQPRGIAVGDVNGDGYSDIAMAGASSMVLLRQVARNSPPDCSTVRVVSGSMTSPDGGFRTIQLGGGVDPDGDPVSITITRVRQNEPVTDSADKTSPDAVAGGSPDRVELRAERNPKGDGRVYEISFRASDGQGGTCSGAVSVTVPKNPADAPINSAPPWFDSVGACLAQPTG